MRVLASFCVRKGFSCPETHDDAVELDGVLELGARRFAFTAVFPSSYDSRRKRAHLQNPAERNVMDCATLGQTVSAQRRHRLLLLSSSGFGDGS